MHQSTINIKNITPDQPFLKILAAQLLEEYKDNIAALSDILILLPTRRTCRALQDCFLDLSQDKPLLLPQMQPIGDIDAEQLSLLLQKNQDLSLIPPLPSIKRQLLLKKLIEKRGLSHGLEQDLALAKALGGLMDEIHTENLDFSTLPSLVEEQEIAEHWQITLQFLEILSIHWPLILEEMGTIEASKYRNDLMMALNAHWQTTPPQFPIIMAGSTGSIPATASLAKTIATLPNGQIILPGLDTIMDDSAWDAVEEGHPQATLKILLQKLEISRDDITSYVPNPENPNRFDLISQIMLPATQTNQWGNDIINITEVKNDLKNIERYDCDTIQQEADIISLILRETLEDENKTAALITTNRALARRVSTRCKKWGITLDDSAGINLKDTPLGQYLLLALNTFIGEMNSVTLLSFLKHDFTTLKNDPNFRTNTRLLETNLLRGKPISNGIEGLISTYHQKIKNPEEYKKPPAELLEFLTALDNSTKKFSLILQSNKSDFDILLKTHIELAEYFFGIDDRSLWSGENGEAASKLLSELYHYTDIIGEISPFEYKKIIEEFISGVTVRPKFGTHPRLQILGQIEGRLINTDRVILAGLNEGSWPPDAGHDPWMSRPMRQKFGLPIPERAITLAAHDFAQAFCAKEVFLTRSRRVDGTPTVPARWLERMDTYLAAINIDSNIIKNGRFKSYLTHLDKAVRENEFKQPSPTPPVESRPTQLSVTYIDKWMKDPYSIYAQKILKLEKLSPLNDSSSASDKGIIFHEILHRFNKKYQKHLTNVTSADFIDIANEVFIENPSIEEDLSFWKPRLFEFAENYLQFEKKWRESYQYYTGETKGIIDFNKSDSVNFKLSARVDRIDQNNDGTYAIIDYKSGGTFSATRISTGAHPQLPLEGLILTEGEFEKVTNPDRNINYLGYWVIDNAKQSIKETQLTGIEKTQDSIATTKEGLLTLITTYQNSDTAYIAIPDLNDAPRFNDFEYLERVKEWAALGEHEENEAAA